MENKDAIFEEELMDLEEIFDEDSSRRCWGSIYRIWQRRNRFYRVIIEVVPFCVLFV